jgi:hypothetical protein
MVLPTQLGAARVLLAVKATRGVCMTAGLLQRLEAAHKSFVALLTVAGVDEHAYA